MSAYKEESICLFRVVDTIGGRGRCIKQFVPIARKSVKFLLSPAGTGPSIAKSVFQRRKRAVVKSSAV